MRRVEMPASVLSLLSVALAVALVGGCASNEMDPGMATPVLTSITPSTGPTTGGITLLITGQNFEPGATVSFAGEPSTQVAVTSPTQMTVVLPARPGAFGKVPVLVKNSSGQMVSRGDLFSYFANRFEVSPAVSFNTAMGPNFVVAGDFNSDGKLDVVSANNTSGNVTSLLGNGQGGFGSGTAYPAGNGPVTAAVGDFNSDSKLDVAVVNSGGFNVSILLGNGAGGFAAPGNFAVGGRPNGIAVGEALGNCEMGYSESVAASRTPDQFADLRNSNRNV